MKLFRWFHENREFHMAVELGTHPAHPKYRWQIVETETNVVRALSPVQGWDSRDEAIADGEGLLKGLNADYIDVRTEPPGA